MVGPIQVHVLTEKSTAKRDEGEDFILVEI